MTTLTVSADNSQAERDFQEKIKERMRQAFGDLMPDSVLAGIVAKGIEDAFFKKQMRPSGQYPYREEAYPSWLIEFIEKEAKDQTQGAVKKWIVENEDKVAEIMKQVLADGMGSAVVLAFTSIFRDAFSHLQSQMSDAFMALTKQR